MSVEQMVELFVSLALEQDQADLDDEQSKVNSLFLEIKSLETELKARSGDQRRALLPLYDHPKAQVRLKAATATLAVAPEAARSTLQLISDRNEYPQAANARGLLSALHDGGFIPS